MNVHARTLIKVGHSTALIIPPHMLDHIHVNPGDVCILDATHQGYIVVTKSPPVDPDPIPVPDPQEKPPDASNL